jgi:hypothetical protein
LYYCVVIIFGSSAFVLMLGNAMFKDI